MDANPEIKLQPLKHVCVARRLARNCGPINVYLLSVYSAAVLNNAVSCV